MRPKWFLPFLAFIFLFGCSNQVATSALPLPTPAVKSSETPTPSPFPSLTPTSRPSPVYTATALPTPILSPLDAAEATEQAAVERFCGSPEYPYREGFLLSKSGKFVALVCRPLDDKDMSVTMVIPLDGFHFPVQVSYRKDYLGIDYSQPLPQDIQDGYKFSPDRYALYPAHWTADDKFLYLVKYSPVGGVQYNQVLALMRLNVETGKLTPILSPTGAYYYDFSPDGTKLLSVDQAKEPMIVKVANLVTGEEIHVRLDERFDQAGYLSLSPDGGKVVISTIDNEAGISLIVADLLSGSQEYLATDLHYDFFPISWFDDRTIYGWSAESGSWSSIYIDILTKQTRPAPTPTLIPTSTS